MIYLDGHQHRVVDEKNLVDELFNEIAKKRPGAVEDKKK